VLDAGCGPGADLLALRERYADATVFGVDLSTRMLQTARRRSAEGASVGWRRWLPASLERMLAGGDGSLAQADFTVLPFATGVFDLLWSNLALQWNALPDRIFPEWQRTLKNGGLLMFSTLGPDTLRELRAAWRVVDSQAERSTDAAIDSASSISSPDSASVQIRAQALASSTNTQTQAQAQAQATSPAIPRVVDFVDMHDFGDMLVASGFEVPVMDTETLTITYGSPQTLLADVRRWGAYPHPDGRAALRGLTGRGTLAALHAALEAQRGSDGKLALTFEVVYGHAWKSTPRTTAEGHAIVRLDAIGRGAAPANKGLKKGPSGV
jgi:malonyl-CoA O-methyltransferase